VWLDVPPEVAVRLVGRKGERDYLKGEDDIHEGDLNYLLATRRTYASLSEGEGWCKVACAPDGELLSEEAVSELVWQRVGQLMECATDQ
jgi:thymidylate kinase